MSFSRVFCFSLLITSDVTIFAKFGFRLISIRLLLAQNRDFDFDLIFQLKSGFRFGRNMASSDADDDIIISSALLIASSLYQRIIW